jgi:hypothetical protein
MPIWPVAALVTVAAATLIGINLIDEAPSQGVVTSVTQTERLANSSAAVREQGAVLPVVVGISHVTPKSVGFSGLEYAGAYITEAPAFAPGLENPGAYPPEVVAPAEGPGVIVNGEACMQCR